jgi:peptidyl-prolyl cis-trans isomerase C
MDDLRRRLLAGESFSGLAREFSEDEASAASGGRLRRFARGTMVGPFEDAAFALRQPGEISPIIETPFGLHLIQLVRRDQARQLSFDEVKPALLSRLRKEWLDERVEEWRQAIVDPEKAVIDEDAIDKALTEISSELSE